MPGVRLQCLVRAYGAADDPEDHIQFVFKSSPFGSIGHSHADQNAVCMSAYGEDLAIQSGHYVVFNASMHRNWRRQTRSKNAILINGKDQYAEADKSKAMAATGGTSFRNAGGRAGFYRRG